MGPHSKPLSLGFCGEIEIIADMTRGIDSAHTRTIQLTADFRFVRPSGFPHLLNWAGTWRGPSPPAVLPSGTVMRALGSMADALIAANCAVEA